METLGLTAISALGGEVVRFDAIKPEDMLQRTLDAICTHRARIDGICGSKVSSFDAVLGAREAADVALSHSWSPFSHYAMVANTPAVREAHAAAQAALTEHYIWVGQNRDLYDATLAACPTATDGWNADQRRLRDLALRDFELAGIALEGAARDRFKEIGTELARLNTQFGNAVLDATDSFHIDLCHKRSLAGIPATHLARFRQAAQAAGVPGWRIGLQAPDVVAVLAHAKSRQLRKAIYRAYNTRASGESPENGNGQRIERIMALRHEAAQLLGFPTIADRSLATKMAPSPSAVESFLLDLSASAKPRAEAELAMLREHAASALGIRDLRPWDVAYAAESLRRARFDLDAEAVRAYFPASRVVDGAMTLLTRLFGVQFLARPDIPVWHPDACYFDVTEGNGKVIAGVYLDLFARSGKQGGAWMDVCRRRFRDNDAISLPVAYLTCNFAKAINGQPATLGHDDVVTFLHEFGHVLHHILTEVDYPTLGGINGVEWDAIELPSQLMENFAWDYSSLALLSAHVQTGERLPRDLFDRMLAARNFQSGIRLCRQIELALFDLRLHRDYDPPRGAQLMPLLKQVRREVAVITPPAWHRTPHTFTHIFASAYWAGYYSYLWAELLSADAFGRFREAGGICAKTGEALRAEILSRGSTRPASESFAAFRGRAPDKAALLKSYGLED